MLRSFLGEGHRRMVVFPAPIAASIFTYTTVLGQEAPAYGPLWEQKLPQCCSILGHLDIRLHLQHHLKQGRDTGHGSPAHSLSHSPPSGQPWQMLLISVFNDSTWVSKHVACGISLVGIPDLRTPNARCGQGTVPADKVSWCRCCRAVVSEV